MNFVFKEKKRMANFFSSLCFFSKQIVCVWPSQPIEQVNIGFDAAMLSLDSWRYVTGGKIDCCSNNIYSQQTKERMKQKKKKKKSGKKLNVLGARYVVCVPTGHHHDRFSKSNSDRDFFRIGQNKAKIEICIPNGL